MGYDRHSSRLPSDLAAIPFSGFVEQVDAAYRERDRQQFLTLAQRIARDAVMRIHADRLLPHREDLRSEGVLAILAAFDKSNRPMAKCYWYFRQVARYAALTWAYQQKLIRRKGAKHATVLREADISASSDCDTAFIESAPAPAESEVDAELEGRLFEAAIDVTDLKILHSLQDGMTRFQIAEELHLTDRVITTRLEVIRARIEGNQRSIAIRFAPHALRAAGYSYPAIATLLGITDDQARRECGDLTPKERRQGAKRRERQAKRAEAWKRCMDNPELNVWDVFATVA